MSRQSQFCRQRVSQKGVRAYDGTQQQHGVHVEMQHVQPYDIGQGERQTDRQHSEHHASVSEFVELIEVDGESGRKDEIQQADSSQQDNGSVSSEKAGHARTNHHPRQNQPNGGW